MKNVVILEHPPRFDIKAKDPLSLKSEFAKYANNMYQQLWFASDMKDKISIGQHNLQCSEEVRISRYTNDKNNRYDGIHFFGLDGRRSLTDSVLTIIRSNLPSASLRLRPRPNTEDNQTRSNPRYSVPVQNRFNVLGN